MTLESNIDAVFFTKLSKMNKQDTYNVRSVTRYFSVGPNTLALTAGRCPVNTPIITSAVILGKYRRIE